MSISSHVRLKSARFDSAHYSIHVAQTSFHLSTFLDRIPCVSNRTASMHIFYLGPKKMKKKMFRSLFPRSKAFNPMEHGIILFSILWAHFEDTEFAYIQGKNINYPLLLMIQKLGLFILKSIIFCLISCFVHI